MLLAWVNKYDKQTSDNRGNGVYSTLKGNLSLLSFLLWERRSDLLVKWYPGPDFNFNKSTQYPLHQQTWHLYTRTGASVTFAKPCHFQNLSQWKSIQISLRRGIWKGQTVYMQKEALSITPLNTRTHIHTHIHTLIPHKIIIKREDLFEWSW